MPTQTAASPALANALDHLQQTRTATLRFIAPLSPEDMMVQSTPEASPAKWHLAHTSWFFETFVLADFLPAYQPFHPDFRWLFNSYYNAVGDQPEKKLRASFSRPPLGDILAYRMHVGRALTHLLDLELAPETEAELLRRIHLGIHHEQQHLELLVTDIKHALYTNPLHPAYTPDPEQARPAAQDASAGRSLTYTSFPGGLVPIGLNLNPEDPATFAFDNETPRHQVFLQPFQLADRLTTCAEYLAFMADRAYTRPELWLSEGWSTMRAAGWQAPLYWMPVQGQDPATPEGWNIYTLHGIRPLTELLHTPVTHLSFFEADAFARWSGCRLPTEFEWEHAANSLRPDPSEAHMLERDTLHPQAILPSARGLQQLFGDTWEWTASPYTGYPGYRPLPGALGEYNGKFMSSQIILRGGSVATPASHIRSTYRNFFPPPTRWQFSGLRLAKDA